MDLMHNTGYWLDYYTAFLEQIYSRVSDPKAWYDKLGLSDDKNAMPAPQKASLESINESKEAWAAVRRDLRVFGLSLSEHLEFEPESAMYAADPARLPSTPAENARAKRELLEWSKNPWFSAKHEFELVPLRFEGRKAMTAVNFFMWWINQTNGRVDPREETKKILLQQGINAENFHLHADKLLIKNPWA